jgi:CheY-like chemotaxis protein
MVIGFLLFKLFAPIKSLVESARSRKFTIKVAGNELSMEEASEQQRLLLADVQSKVVELEKRTTVLAPAHAPSAEPRPTGKRILWVDDKPRNNSFLIAALEERGARVDTALSTEEGIKKLGDSRYDIVISDMGRPEGEKAGIELARRVHERAPGVPVYIYCGKWAAMNLREEALAAGVSEITSSGSTLMAALPL